MRVVNKSVAVLAMITKDKSDSFVKMSIALQLRLYHLEVVKIVDDTYRSV